MTLQQLKYVVTVAETGTITEAANRLYISQPSLSRSISTLEEELGIKLQWFDNKLPEYQVTVSSLLCNQEE